MTSRRKWRALLLASCVAPWLAAGSTRSAAATAEEALGRVFNAADYAAATSALAQWSETPVAENARALPYSFALAVKFRQESDATRTLEALLTRARAQQDPNELVDAVYHAIRRSVPAACGATPLAGKKFLAREFQRHHASFIPLLERAANAAVAIAPNAGHCLAAKADVALLAGDLRVAAECTRKTLPQIKHPAAQANTQRYLAELENALRTSAANE